MQNMVFNCLWRNGLVGRLKEFREKGYDLKYQAVLDDISKRDFLDSTRENCTFKPAQDALIIDTSNMSLTEVVAKISKLFWGENSAL